MNPKTKFKIILSNDVGFGDSKKRKGHQRTRFGCLTCKAKKVKVFLAQAAQLATSNVE